MNLVVLAAVVVAFAAPIFGYQAAKYLDERKERRESHPG